MTSDFKVIILVIASYTFGTFVGYHNSPWYVGAAGMGLTGYFSGRIARWISAND